MSCSQNPLIELWAAPDSSRLAAKQVSVRLPVHVMARIRALEDMFPTRTRTDINGMPMGFKAIAEYLASRGITRRGKPWRRGAISDVLADRVYVGEYFFNKKCARTRQPKPGAEWISIAVPPVVTETLYTRAEERRHARHPEKVPPSPTLLTGLLKCGECGAGMTLATGKGGLYRYYKCTNRINKGNPHCGSGNVRMERFNDAVIGAVTERLCQPERLD